MFRTIMHGPGLPYSRRTIVTVGKREICNNFAIYKHVSFIPSVCVSRGQCNIDTPCCYGNSVMVVTREI